MADTYKFNREGTERIVKAVRRVEGQLQNPGLIRATGPRAVSDPGMKRGKLDGTLSVGGSATMSVWKWNGSAEADTGDNITVYDFLLASGQTIASGKKVVAEWDSASGRWYVVSAEC